MDLKQYDLIVINTSGGKDSQTMMRQVVLMAEAQEFPKHNIIAAHADLGRMEWSGTRQLAQKQAEVYDISFHAISRPQGDILEQVEARGMWPSSTTRFCTSDHKRDQISKIITKLHRERGIKGRTFRVLNCMGLRAQESPARAKKPEMELNKRLTTNSREVWTWLPILHWTEEEVWQDIEASGVEHHKAYDLGMPRLSCIFCIFAPRPALILAGKHNPELLADYVDVEQKINHTFRVDLALKSIQDAVHAGEHVDAMNGQWNM